MKYEFLLHVWGGFFNKEHQEKHSFQPGYYWFDSAEERTGFLKALRIVEKNLDALHLMVSESEGTQTRLQTVAKMNLAYMGKSFEFGYNFGYDCTPETARYMFEDGNYSCDCNRSMFLAQILDGEFPELECGNEIEISNLIIERLGGSMESFDPEP